MPKGVYARKPRTPKQYPPELVERVRQLYEEGRTQGEVAAALGVTQKVIWRLMLHHGIGAREAKQRSPRMGPDNHAWRGDEAGYQALHMRVEAARGKPDHCEWCGSEGDPEKVYEWANLTGRYTDVADYARLCRHCHRAYDDDRRGGAPGYRADVTPGIVAALLSRGLSVNEIARRLGVSWPTVRSRMP